MIPGKLVFSGEVELLFEGSLLCNFSAVETSDDRCDLFSIVHYL